MTQTDVNEFLLEGGVPSAKFPAVGTMVHGTVISAELREQTDINTGTTLYWQNGQPRMQVVITLQTEERDPAIDEDDGQRRLFAKNNMLKAIREACRPHGGLQAGGKLMVRYTGDGEQKTRGFNPPKLYAAKYQPPPAPTLNIGGGDGDADDDDPF